MKIKGLRWYIAFLLCLASALNYLDRQTLSVLIGTIKQELHMTATPLVCLFSVTRSGTPHLTLLLVAGMTFCHGGWSNITLPAEVFPQNAIATVTGLGGALGSWMGALAMLTTGHVVDAYGFSPVFIACAVLYSTALLLVYVLIGQLGVVRQIPSESYGAQPQS